MNIEKNGDFVSEIRNHLKANNKDDYVSARYILSVGYSYVSYLINNRRLSETLRDLDAFTFVPCLEMERVKSYKCDIAEFKTCDKIMKSKCQLPDIIQSKLGYLVESVTNIDHTEEYYQLRSAADYTIKKKRKFANNFKYFYVSSDRHLYLLNTTSEIVNINALFLEEEAAKCLSDCDDDCDDCKSKLDDKFICPERFKSTVRDQTLQKLLNRVQVPRDEKPDLDENQKTNAQIQQQ